MAAEEGSQAPSIEDFLWDEHTRYIINLNTRQKGTFEYYVTEHLRMSGMYWGLNALSLLRQLPALPAERIFEYVLRCYHPSIGGFSGNVGHDPNLLYTLSAVQILLLIERLDDSRVDLPAICSYVSSLQNEDGSFRGDEWGEIDTRFSYAAVSCLSILGSLNLVDVDKAASWVLTCQNFDGGFGVCPGAESHGGQIFCCVGVLAIADRLADMDHDRLSWWLCERQCKNGGLNGRPEKLADVCYSWWDLSALKIMDRTHWVDRDRLVKFMLSTQDITGGMSDRPGDMVDVFHTLFGIGGLSMLEAIHGLRPIDPVYCLPVHVLKKHGIVTACTEVYDEEEDARIAEEVLQLHPIQFVDPSDYGLVADEKGDDEVVVDEKQDEEVVDVESGEEKEGEVETE